MRLVVSLCFAACLVACSDDGGSKKNANGNPGGTTVLNISDYAVSCTDASECADVFIGDVGECGCYCPNAAISRSARSQYSDDYQNAERNGVRNTGVCDVSCGDCPAAVVTCDGTTCGFEFRPGDAGVDAGQ